MSIMILIIVLLELAPQRESRLYHHQITSVSHLNSILQPNHHSPQADAL